MVKYKLKEKYTNTASSVNTKIMKVVPKWVYPLVGLQSLAILILLLIK